MTSKRLDRPALTAMLGVLLLAAIVRILNIDGPALWTDEGFTYYTFRVDLFDALVNDRHPPFYFYTLHAWEAFTGDSVLALRWWSMLPSLLTIAVSYQLGRELLHHLPDLPARAGALGLPVLVAVLMTLADAENYMAQELRMYTWHVLFATCSTWAYLRFIRRPDDRKRGLLYVVAGVLLMYTHYFGGFVLLAHGLHALIFLRGRGRLFTLGALIIIGVAFVPWFFAVTLDQFADEPVSITAEQIDPQAVLLDFRDKWFGQQWPLMLLLFGAGIYGLLERRKSSGMGGLLAALLIIPVALTTLIGHDELILLARRLVQITVPIAVLIALGVSRFPASARAVIVAALLIYGVTTVDWYRVKVPWHTVTDLIAEYARPGELALAEVAFEASALRYYYDHQLPDGMQINTFPVWSDTPRFEYYDDTLPALLAEQSTLQDQTITAWVTYFSPDDGMLRRLEEAGYLRTMTQTYDHIGSQIDVYRYDQLPDEPLDTFTNGMVLRAAAIIPEERRVDLWWGVNAPIDVDYTVSAVILDADGQLVAQLDSQPQNNTRPTSGITADEVVYDPRRLTLVDGISALPPGAYTAAVRVYRFVDGTIQPVSTVNGAPDLQLGTFTR